MLLAEAVKEKEFLEKSIDDLVEHIIILNISRRDVSVSKREKQASIVQDRLTALKDLYQRCQKFGVTIERAKAKVTIKVNDTDLSLIDAVTFCGFMRKKYDDLKRIKEAAFDIIRSQSETEYVLDLDELHKAMEETALNIKTLDSEITYALWNTEV